MTGYDPFAETDGFQEGEEETPPDPSTAAEAVEDLIDAGVVTQGVKEDETRLAAIDAAWERTARLHEKMGFASYNDPNLPGPYRGYAEVRDRNPAAVARVYKEASSEDLWALLEEHGFPPKVVEYYCAQRERMIEAERKAMEHPGFAAFAAQEAGRNAKMEAVRAGFIAKMKKAEKK